MASYMSYYVHASDPHATSSWTQLDGTGKGPSTAFTRVIEWRPSGPIQHAASKSEVAQRSGALLDMSDNVAMSRRGVLFVQSQYTGADTGDNLRAELMDEWADIVDTVNAHDGEMALRIDRPDRSAATLSHSLICKVVGTPEWQPFNNHDVAIVMELEIGIEVLYPYWIQRTPDADTYLNVAGSVGNTVNNTGHTDDLGCEIVIDTVDLSTTQLTVANATTSKTIIIDIATDFTAGDKISWFGTDPRQVEISTTNAAHFGSTVAGGNAFMARGNNTVNMTSDGQVDCTLNIYPERYSP